MSEGYKRQYLGGLITPPESKLHRRIDELEKRVEELEAELKLIKERLFDDDGK